MSIVARCTNSHSDPAWRATASSAASSESSKPPELTASTESPWVIEPGGSPVELAPDLDAELMAEEASFA
jgi:hypothetical protein